MRRQRMLYNLKLWELRNELRNIKDKKAYCRTILTNICKDRWRILSKQYSEELNEDLIRGAEELATRVYKQYGYKSIVVSGKAGKRFYLFGKYKDGDEQHGISSLLLVITRREIDAAITRKGEAYKAGPPVYICYKRELKRHHSICRARGEPKPIKTT